MSLYSYMLFRDKDGQLVELMRCKFTSDTDYYKAIIKTRDTPNIAKTSSAKDKIVGIIKRKR